MTKLRVIVADDEAQLRKSLIKMLTYLWPELDIVFEAGSGTEALQLIRDEEVDIAFLDIRMPGLSGIEVARKIGGRCHCVFVTAYESYAVQAFEESAVDYLMKPVEEQRLEKCIERLKMRMDNTKETDNIDELTQRLKQQENRLFIQPLSWIRTSDKDEIHIIPIQDVIYFQAQDKYTSVFTAKDEWLIRKSIKELEAELAPEQFWRIHRKFIINLNFVEKVKRGTDSRYKVMLALQDKSLPVSRSYSHLFKSM